MGICNDGKDVLLSRIHGTSDIAMSHIGVGTDTTPFDLTDTALGTEIEIVATNERKSATFSKTGTGELTVTGAISTSQCNGSSLTEVGIFNDKDNDQGDMLCRQVHSAIAKTASISVNYSIVLEVE